MVGDYEVSRSSCSGCLILPLEISHVRQWMLSLRPPKIQIKKGR